MVDFFASNSEGLDSPADNYYAITPSDSADLPFRPRAIYVGTGGNLVLREQQGGGGTAVTFTNVPNGAVLPVRAWRVVATGTTASNIVGLY